jgi:glycosyltransferase involved in cell wall biosynthesis
MKVIHIPFCFYPDPVAGTEVFVESLAGRLNQWGIEAVIAAPGESSGRYQHQGLAVRRFAVSGEIDDLRELYGEGDLNAAREFARILDEEQPDLIHLHAFTSGASIRLVREAKRRGIKVAFTYHTPTVSCQRGTLMRWGSEICDGRLNLHTCAACTLNSLGVGRVGSQVLGRMPRVVGRLAGSVGLSGGVWTAVRMSELIQVRHSAFSSLMREVDQVLVPCQWVKELLLCNSVPAEKITISRYALPRQTEIAELEKERRQATDEPLRMAFLGRMDQTKGPDLLIKALRAMPKSEIELHLYGIVQSGAAAEYTEQLKRLAEGDSRIRFLPTVPSDRIVSALRGYHLLTVPSRWLETGPLVVLEAFAAGIPVIGSDLGGIAELVRNEIDGLLVETGSVESWKRAIERCYQDRSFLARLRRGIREPRSMDQVTREIVLVYRQMMQQSAIRDCL